MHIGTTVAGLLLLLWQTHNLIGTDSTPVMHAATVLALDTMTAAIAAATSILSHL